MCLTNDEWGHVLCDVIKRCNIKRVGKWEDLEKLILQARGEIAGLPHNPRTDPTAHINRIVGNVHSGLYDLIITRSYSQ